MRIRKRLFPLVLAMAVLLGMVSVPASAADEVLPEAPVFSDMPDNWSTAALQNAVANGLLQGEDGKIMPDDNLTRAQMATVIARAFGAKVQGDISSFTDVQADDWYADSIAKAYQMGVLKGADGRMNPRNAITRQEVFVILSRAFKLTPAGSAQKAFSDADQIAEWAKSEVYALVNAGYVQGSDGRLNPAGLITRAEFAQVLDNILKQYISASGVYTEVAQGNIMINAPGVTLKNLTVSGDLIIGDGVGDGDVVLDNVKVTGRMVVRGGGENSVIIKGSSSVSSIIVSRVDGAVSVKVQGDADVELIYIDDGSDDVSIQGAVGRVEIQAPGISVSAVGASIGSIDIAMANTSLTVDAASTVGSVGVLPGATGTNIDVRGTVSAVTTNAAGTTVAGSGTVTQVEVLAGADNSKIETPKTQITVGSGVNGVTGGDGAPIEGGSTVNNGGTTPPSGEGSDNTPPAKKAPVVTIDLPEDGFVVGAKSIFTVTTKANGYAGTMVIGNSAFEDSDVIESLEYYEVKNDTWYLLSGDFGPSEGFPLSDTTSKFRISFNTAGDYEFTVNIRKASNHNNILASKTARFTVAELEESTAVVDDINGLNAALDNEAVETVYINNDITSANAPVIVDREVTIYGNGYTLSSTGLEDREELEGDDGLIIFADTIVNDLTVDAGLENPGEWDGVYAIHVYGEVEATLNNVSATGANGGILANGSQVTLTGTVDVSGNGFGGIEVGKGKDVSSTPSLIIEAGTTLTNGSEAFGKPTVWMEEGVDGDIDDEAFAVTDKIKIGQTQYYLDAAKAVDSIAPVLGEVTLEEEDGTGYLVLIVNATDNGALASLEVDHSLDGKDVPEFTVSTTAVTDPLTGASSTFKNGKWTINFGDEMSDLVREKTAPSGEITFYFVIKDASGNQFGDMYNVTEDMTKTFTLPVAGD